MAAKRTAFGDVSNVVKNINVHDDLLAVGKSNGYDVIQKPTLQEKPAGFLRPAQRPLTVAGLKGILNSSTVNSAAPSITTAASNVKVPFVPEIQQPKPHKLLKRAATTAIYKDSTATEEVPISQPSIPQNVAPVAPVHQALGPRHHKSQPQLKSDAPSLRRVESKAFHAPVEQKVIETVTSASTYEDLLDQQITEAHIDDYASYAVLAEQNREDQLAEDAAVQLRDEMDRQLPPLPLLSEPEEYWEEEDDEIYDEQGYTTAHSTRSRGDNTTGGATTVLFPKVNNKVKKELAIAKDLVESSRTQEEIEDEAWDTSMVAEYGDEIFAYMRELEVSNFIGQCKFANVDTSIRPRLCGRYLL
jgi:G2/mitotic-specific cyclin 3/4